MLKRCRSFLASVAVVSCALSCGSVDANDMPAEVVSILKENCLKCHGQKKRSGKLDLRSVDAILAGGKRGPSIERADARSSRLLQLLQPGAKPHMPPGKKQLSDEQIATLTNWVVQFQIEPDTSVSLEPDTADRQPEAEPKQTSETPSNDMALLSGIAPTTVINLLVQAGYVRDKIVPTEPCSDQQYVRRLYLDLIGRIPTVDEVDRFLARTDSAKRRELVEQLMASKEFARHFSQAFDTMLMGRNERKLTDRRQHGWHRYLETVFQDNRPWDEVAREVLLARGSSADRGHLWFLYERDNKHQDIAEGIAKGFFGVDIACAQCHDHPLAGEIKQAHYWGLVAFFKRSKNVDAKHGLAIGESAIGGFDSYSNALTGSTDDSVLTFLKRDAVREDRPADPKEEKDSDELYVSVEDEPRVPRFSRREKFVESVVKGHPLLSRNMVNRVWALVMGRGLVHPVDEMDSQHLPSHPRLLDWLAQDFESGGYDIHRLVRAIVLSDAYQLSSRRRANAPEEKAFAFGLEKPLTAEAMSRSLMTALCIDAGDKSGVEENVKAVESEFRKLFPEVLPENSLTNLKQTLLLSNHPALQTLFDAAAGKIDTSSDPASLVRQFYDRIYGRSPDEDELVAVVDYLVQRPENPQAAIAQVLWAMVTSAEFRLNH